MEYTNTSEVLEYYHSNMQLIMDNMWNLEKMKAVNRLLKGSEK